MQSKRPSCTTYQTKSISSTISSSYSLDMQYLTLKDQILNSNYYRLVAKSIKIRINNWLTALDNVIVNSVWKKNRNNHAKLINLMCDCELILAPYSKYPPNGEVPNLSKHQINAIIDQVELAVKNSEKNASRKNTKREVLGELQNAQEYWSRMRELKEQSQISMEEGSSLVGRIMDIAQRSNVLENGKENICGDSKINIIDVKEGESPQTIKKETKAQPISTDTAQKYRKVRSGYIDLKESTPSSYFSKNKRVNNQFANQNQPPVMYRDMRQSVERNNDTLNTDSFDCSDDDCDFTDELSERCKERDVAVKDYFDWKKKSFSSELKTVSQKQSQESPEVNQNINFQTFVAVEESSLTLTTSIHQEQTALNLPQPSKVQQLRKFYWQQNFSESDDFQYIESPEKITIQSNQDGKSRASSVMHDLTTDAMN